MIYEDGLSISVLYQFIEFRVTYQILDINPLLLINVFFAINVHGIFVSMISSMLGSYHAWIFLLDLAELGNQYRH